jgi:CheY-like chemotaxis protein
VRDLEAVSKPIGVIVAEFDPVIRSMLRTRLEALHQDVFLANDGLEAVTLASRVRASLVILDIQMSELNGIRACSQIRALPGYESTPILMMTFHDTERLKNIAAQAGASMFLAKPFGESTLLRVLSKCLPSTELAPGMMHASVARADAVTRSAGLLVSDVEQAGIAPPLGPAEIPNGCAKPGGVIVADDDPLIRSILKAQLEILGQDVLLAHNGLEAVTLASRSLASLIILDIGMPKMDGIVACTRIRELSGYALTPIVMLTFNDTGTAKASASRAGASMFLAKPFGSAALMLALSRFLPLPDETIRIIHETAVRAAGGRVFTKMHS